MVVMDKFTLEMGNSFSEGMHVPKYQVTYKKMIKEDSMFKKSSQVSKTWWQVLRLLCAEQRGRHHHSHAGLFSGSWSPEFP